MHYFNGLKISCVLSFLIHFSFKFASLEDALKVPGNVAITAHMFEVRSGNNFGIFLGYQ